MWVLPMILFVRGSIFKQVGRPVLADPDGLASAAGGARSCSSGDLDPSDDCRRIGGGACDDEQPEHRGGEEIAHVPR